MAAFSNGNENSAGRNHENDRLGWHQSDHFPGTDGRRTATNRGCEFARNHCADGTPTAHDTRTRTASRFRRAPGTGRDVAPLAGGIDGERRPGGMGARSGGATSAPEEETESRSDHPSPNHRSDSEPMPYDTQPTRDVGFGWRDRVSTREARQMRMKRPRLLTPTERATGEKVAAFLVKVHPTLDQRLRAAMKQEQRSRNELVRAAVTRLLAELGY